MKIERATIDVSRECERILRTLPRWFGIESALLDYARDSGRFPTFLACAEDRSVGFLTVREHFPESWEVHCIAIEASARGAGIGRKLHDHVEAWLRSQGVRWLQVKTLSAAHPSPEYAQTRAFYARIGYTPLESFPTLWGPGLPVLQLVKELGSSQATS
jgi:GNAT superfamily N-acetyltransferase